MRFFHGISNCMEHSLHFYTGFTLVDITATGVTRGNDIQQRGQQSNWETVLQTIGLISQPMDICEPTRLESSLDYLEFGDLYQGTHSVWAWSFRVEHADVFADASNPLGRLNNYFDQVPVVCGLDETARFMLPIFFTSGSIKNTYFKIGQKDLNNI